MLLQDILGFNPEGNKMLIQGLNSNKVTYLGSTCPTYARKNCSVESFLIEPIRDYAELLLVKVAEINTKGCHTRNSFHLIEVTWKNKKPFVDNKHNFITGKSGRPWFLDEKGFLYVYISNKAYTNNQNEKDSYFINDVDIMLKYIIDQINENVIITAAEDTEKVISLQEDYDVLTKEAEVLRETAVRYEKICEYAVQTINGNNDGTISMPNNPISLIINQHAELLTSQDSFLDLLKDTLRSLKGAKGSSGPARLQSLSQAIGTRSINNEHEAALSEIIRWHTKIIKERDTWKELARNLRRAVRIHWFGFRCLGTKRRAVNDAANAIPPLYGE